MGCILSFEFASFLVTVLTCLNVPQSEGNVKKGFFLGTFNLLLCIIPMQACVDFRNRYHSWLFYIMLCRGCKSNISLVYLKGLLVHWLRAFWKYCQVLLLLTRYWSIQTCIFIMMKWKVPWLHFLFMPSGLKIYFVIFNTWCADKSFTGPISSSI